MIEAETTEPARTKAERARDWLAREIRIGNFTRGSVLPPERELAGQIGVSYMTLRKAVGALVDEGLLERNQGSGTFVRNEISEQKVQKVLGLVMPAWSTPENLDTVMHYSKACQDNNWLLKVIYVRSWEDRSILDLYLSCDALVMMTIEDLLRIPSYLLEKLRSRVKPVVFSGTSAQFIDGDSVYYWNDFQMEAPCDRLHELGHRRIFLVDQMIRRQGELTTIHPSSQGFEQIFHRKYPDVEFNTEIMSLEIPFFQQPHYMIRQTIREKRQELSGYTAAICPLSFFWGVMSGLRDIGLRVPEDMSVLTFGDRQEAEFYCPRPSEFSVQLKNQARRTLELIFWRFANPDARPVNYQTDVEFIEGETIAPAKKQTSNPKGKA